MVFIRVVTWKIYVPDYRIIYYQVRVTTQIRITVFQRIQQMENFHKLTRTLCITSEFYLCCTLFNAFIGKQIFTTSGEFGDLRYKMGA